MRLDHIAYRVANRYDTAQFFISAFGYSLQTEFEVEFEDGTCAKCLALEPPEKLEGVTNDDFITSVGRTFGPGSSIKIDYHIAPEIFVSDGPPGSIVGDWVTARNGIGGIHHLAYQVDSVEATMQDWTEKGYAEFLSDKPLTCPGLTQVFTKPSNLTGVIYEFIEREGQGFCKDNVKALMESTKDTQ